MAYFSEITINTTLRGCDVELVVEYDATRGNNLRDEGYLDIEVGPIRNAVTGKHVSPRLRNYIEAQCEEEIAEGVYYNEGQDA